MNQRERSVTDPRVSLQGLQLGLYQNDGNSV